MFHNAERVMELFLYVHDDDLKNIYKNKVESHNSKMRNSSFPDAGFDLLTPNSIICNSSTVNKIDFLVSASARITCQNGKTYNSGFYLYPRSSLSSSPLRLANSVGVIDSGYRGNLIGKFDCLPYNQNEYIVDKYTKLVQIVSPGMIPIFVTIVNNIKELGLDTERGAGGFGSTGL